jgi:hypothetical protein
MHVRREDMHIYISSLLKYKMHLHLHDSLHYAIVKFKIQIYICIKDRLIPVIINSERHHLIYPR